jgi:hypothetical protein
VTGRRLFVHEPEGVLESEVHAIIWAKGARMYGIE